MALHTQGYTISPETTDQPSDENIFAAPYSLKIIYFCIGAIGVGGNAFVVLVICTSKSMQKSNTNILIVNQSVIDFIASLFLILTSAIDRDSNHHLEGPLDYAYCAIWLTNSPMWSILVSSTYSLLFITVERYLAVVHAIWHKLSFNKKKMVAFIATAWLIGPIFNFAYTMPTSGLSNGKCKKYAFYPSETTQRAVGIFTIVFKFFLPILLLIFCYLRMIWVLFKRIKVAPAHTAVNPIGAAGSSESKNSTMEANRNDTMKGKSSSMPKDSSVEANKKRAMKNVVKTLALVSICFILCWIWNQTYFLLFNLGYPLTLNEPIYHFSVVAVHCNLCVSPFVYLAQYKKFQDSVKKLFCKRCCLGHVGRETNPSNMSSATACTAP